MKSWARPARPVSPIFVSVAILCVWFLVAHNSGAGWVQVLGDLVFGTLLVGILGPLVILSRAQVEIVTAPADVTAGAPIALHVRASTRLRVRPAQPAGRETFIGPVGRRQPTDDQVTVTASRRGVLESLTLDVASAAPFALQWWTRRVNLPLPAPLHVAPRRGSPGKPPARAVEGDDDHAAWAHADAGHPRGALPYRWGDSRRHVHWRATAHAGELMMQELEQPEAEPVTVTVVLPPDPEEAERIAENALGTLVHFLEQGDPVVLATLEPSGPLVASVADRRGAGRRLARAVSRAGGPAEPPGIALWP
jgi:uncharacterized protein (DUF58 family)